MTEYYETNQLKVSCTEGESENELLKITVIFCHHEKMLKFPFKGAWVSSLISVSKFTVIVLDL